MAGTSAGARKGWLTRRGQRLPRDPQQRARIAAIEEHAAGTFAGPLRRGPAARRQEAPPVPIRRDLPYRDIDPYSPPDPDYLIKAYGSRQLRRVLQDYSMDMLRGTARNVQAKHPGTAPANMSSRQALLDYIVRYSTRPAPAAPAKPSPPVRGQRVRVDASLRPTGHVDLSRLRTSGTIDPYALHEGFGAEQTRRVLDDLTIDSLRQAAAVVERRTGQRPPNRNSGRALREYIMQGIGASPRRETRPAPAAPARRSEKAEQAVTRAQSEYDRAAAEFRRRQFTEDESQFTNVQAALHRAAEKLKAAQKRETRPAPAAPAKSSPPVRGQRVRVDRKPLATVGQTNPQYVAPYVRGANIYALRQIYGDSQMHAALDRYPSNSLRDIVRRVGAVNGRRPPNLNNRGAMIQWLDESARSGDTTRLAEMYHRQNTGVG